MLAFEHHLIKEKCRSVISDSYVYIFECLLGHIFIKVLNVWKVKGFLVTQFFVLNIFSFRIWGFATKPNTCVSKAQGEILDLSCNSFILKYMFLGGEHCHKYRGDLVDKKARKKLILASILCLLFMTGEIIGAWGSSQIVPLYNLVNLRIFRRWLVVQQFGHCHRRGTFADRFRQFHDLTFFAVRVCKTGDAPHELWLVQSRYIEQIWAHTDWVISANFHFRGAGSTFVSATDLGCHGCAGILGCFAYYHWWIRNWCHRHANNIVNRGGSQYCVSFGLFWLCSLQ